MYKRILVLVLSVSMVLGISSCKGFSSRRQDNGRLEVIYIVDSMLPFGMNSPEDYNEWAEKYNEVFDDDIAVTAVIKSNRDLYGEFEIKSIIDETDGGGIVVMPFGYYCSIQDEIPLYFEPLDDYIIKSGISEFFPSSVLEFGTSPKDGLIWCVPVHQYNQRYVRYYSREALDTLGIKPPDTLESLKNALVDYKVKFGKPGLILSSELNDNPFSSVSDLFSLAGIPYPETIIYDENSGNFINIIDNPMTMEILEYINDLYVNGIVGVYEEETHINHFSEMRENGLLTMISRGAGGMYDEMLVPGGLAPEVSGVIPGGQNTFYVALMLKDTKGGQNEFDEYSEIFLRPGTGYIVSAIGFEGIHYDMKDSRMVQKKMPKMPRPEMSYNQLFSLEFYSRNKDSEIYRYYIDEYMSERNRIYPAHVEYIDKNLNRSVDFRDFRDYFSIYFMNAIKEGIDLDEAIELYKYECSQNKIDNLISEVNEKLSETCSTTD